MSSPNPLEFTQFSLPSRSRALFTTAETPASIRDGVHIEVKPTAAARADSRWGAGETDDSRPGGPFYAAIISELRSAARLLAVLLASTGLYALGHSATALAAGLLGRTLVRQGGATGVAPPERAALYSILLLGLLATFVKSISGVLLAYYESQLAGRVGRNLRGRTVKGLLRHGSYDAPPTLLATIAVRIREIEAATSAGFVVLMRSVAQLVPLALALIWLSAPLALAGALLLTPFAVFVARHRSRWRAAHAHSQSLVEGLHRGVDDLVQNVDLWRSYGAGARIAEAIDATNARAVTASARVEAARAALSGVNEVLGALALLGAVMLALYLGIPLGDGTLIAFAAVFFMAYRPLRDLGDARAWCTRGAVATEALAHLVDARGPSAFADGETANSIVHRDSSATCRLRAEATGARARGPTTSFVVEPGELVSVVGPTGSGKTTLLRAMLGLEPATGRLLYGDRDLSGADVGPHSRPFAWVPQEAPLVTDTVLANVALHAADEESAALALKQIGAEHLLGLRDVIVGPGGRALSGGERRQVAIARALASGQPVLLLDEPIAGLDAQAASRVLDALIRVKGRRSMVVVTHRPEVIAISDRVVSIGAS